MRQEMQMDNAQQPGRFHGLRKWILRLLLVFLAPVLCLAILETGLRAGGFGHPVAFFLGPDSNGNFITNHRFGWRFFPQSLSRNPQSCILPGKTTGSIRIFILGSSAAMGTPDAAFSFGRILEVMLREQYPGTRFEVVNGAMTAINSHVVREIARDCAAREPDLLVVYMGNNEVVGPYGPGTVFQRSQPGPWMIRANILAKSMRLGQMIDKIAATVHGRSKIPGRWLGMDMFQDNPVAADDPRMAAVYDNFRNNLIEICKTANRARAGVIVSTVAVNMTGCPPLASRHRAGLASVDLAKWEEAYRAGRELDDRARWTEAISRYEEAAKIDDRYADLQFCMAESLLKAGRPDEARARFVLARDLDALRFRADSRINSIIRDVGLGRADDGVHLVDAELALAAGSTNAMGLPDGDLFYEHVHLNFDGNYKLALAMLDQVCLALPSLAATRPSGQTPSRQRCAELLVLTPWDEYLMASQMVKLATTGAFTNQIGHSLRQAAARQRLNDMRAHVSAPEVKTASWKAYEAALARAPDDWQLHYHFGMLAKQLGRPDIAVQHLRSVVQKLPWDPAKYCELATALNEQGRMDESIVLFRKALELEPGHVDTEIALGATLWRAGRLDDAILQFKGLLRAEPDHEVVHNNLGSALVTRGQLDEAITEYRTALALKPDYAEAYKNLAIALEKKGLMDDAITNYEKALEINPDYPELHFKTGMSLANRGQTGRALAHYLKAIALKPDYGAAHNNLAPLLLRTGLTNEAIAHFQKAADLLPDSVDAHINCGVALKSVGRATEAVPHFRRALELQPHNTVAKRHLDDIMRRESSLSR